MVTLINQLQQTPNLFDDFTLIPQLDRDVLIDLILAEYGTMDTVHSNPKLFKWYSDRWFERKHSIIQKLYETTQFEYDPIENYRRYEDGWENNDDAETRTKTLNTTRSQDSEQIKSQNGTVTEDETRKGTVDSTTDSVGTVSPYNAESWQNDAKTESTSHSDETDTANNTRTIKDDQDIIDQLKAQSDETENENIGNERKKKYGNLAHGNIGVTTTQQMIQQERDVVKFDVYWWICVEWGLDNIVQVL